MKRIILFSLTVLALLSFKSDDKIQEYLSVSGPLSFDGKSFNLKWTSKNGNYYIQEYLSENDSLSNFKEMISLFVLNESVSVEDAIQIKIQELEEFKKTDPVCNYAVTYDPKNRGTLIDFLRGESIGDVTSGTQAPSLGKAIGMGYVKIQDASIGSTIFINVRDKQIKAQVVKMPFA